MKDFVKMTLAAALGVLLVSVVIFFFGLALIGSIAAFGESEPVMPREGVLMLDMSKLTIAEQASADDPISSLTGSGESRTAIGILSAIKAINEAAMDPAVKFIYMKTDGVAADGAILEEFRNALHNFRMSGKAIISYTETPTNSSYYLASVSDKIFMSNYTGGMNMLSGLSSQMMYLKDILDKLGVNVQLIRHGKYKSAGEMYIRNSASAENKEQYKVLIDSIWEAWAETMASSRDMSTDEFNALIDNLELNSPEDFLEHGLVDELLDHYALESRVAGLAGKEKTSDIKFIAFPDYVTIKDVPNYKAKEAVAIIYANGSIVDGYGKQDVAGKRFASIIRDVQADSTVKAVVFRINSPGGSVTASDQIKVAIDSLRKVKPVIASYGGYAASGGYWISNSCDRIFCDRSTLTGSIGVFSMIPDFSGTADKVGINIETINSNRHGDIYSGMRPLNAAELEYFQASVEDIYDSFTSIVAEGRDLDKDFVDNIAQGRVWAGDDALGIGLVDEIGGLETALQYAISVSGSDKYDIKDWRIDEYPAPLTTMDMLLEMFGGGASVLSGTAMDCEPFTSVEREFRNWSSLNAGQVYARLPYEISFR